MGLCITSSQIPRGNLKKLGGGKHKNFLDNFFFFIYKQTIKVCKPSAFKNHTSKTDLRKM